MPKVARIVKMIEEAQRPLILAGHGVRISGAAKLLRGVAATFQIPVATTWNAMDLMPYADPLSAGRPGTVAMRAPNFAVQSCDLLISIGARLDNVVTAHAPENFAPHAKRVLVDIEENELARMPGGLRVHSDAALFLSALLQHSPRSAPDRGAWLERIARWKETYGPLASRDLPERGVPSHYQLVDALSDILPEDAVIATGSSGLAVEAFYSCFRNKPGQRIFLTSGLGAMGYGLPAAIGAHYATGGPVVLYESDGSLMFNIQELATVKNLPITVIVANNEGYASIRNTQRNYFGRFIASGWTSGVVMPNLLQVAYSFGVNAAYIDDVTDLKRGLEFAFAEKRPILVDVRLMQNESLSPKVESMQQPDGSMKSRPLEDMSPLLPRDVLRSEMGQ